jgi:5-methylcytosine-specific restriction enzyme subunit McrC
MIEITISEYGFIGCDNIDTNYNKFVGVRDLEPSLFGELYNFWLEDKETQKVFTFENKNCLKATSYVGIIQTKNLSIEILPKTYDKNTEIETQRHIFTEMLKPLLNVNELQINRANLSTTKNKNIYEMFISLFVQSIDNLIHRGLKSQYIEQENNQFFLKGKLKFNEHIKYNYIHKERFYVAFDEYLQDRVENRLLKSTISLLLRKTNDFENKKALRQQLFIFDEVQLSHNYDIDFKKTNTYRGMEYYKMPLRFAELFLRHKSFTSLRGKEDVFALLFPMENVFESYMEFVLNNSKKNLGISKVIPNGYKGDYLLANGSCKMINQKPDYLLEMQDSSLIISDAKWKLFEMDTRSSKTCKDDEKVNISSSDAYQVFSYLHYYNAQKTAYLFVPNTNSTKEITLNYVRQADKGIKIIPMDLEQLTYQEPRHTLEKMIFSEGYYNG